jgi:TonB family protein
MPKVIAVIVLVLITVTGASAQVISAGGDKCTGKIYRGSEVTQRARIIELGGLTIPKEAREQNVHGTVVLNAVLCRKGRVTDIKVVKGLPFGVTEEAILKLLQMRFAPAEMNFHSVSQAMQFEFSVNEGLSGVSDIDPATVRGRFVEELDFIGNRRITKEKIFEWIKSRPGETFTNEQVQQDLRAILKSGYFNKWTTRVHVEDAVRGGVRVVFELTELPLIAGITFERSRFGEQAAIVNELARQGVDLRVGRPFDPVNLKRAQEVIEGYFRSQGWANVKAEAYAENLMATDVKIVFKITGTNF